MPVIAMTREMGSGGRDVAHRVAEEMGLTVILHELVEHDLAERMHVPDSAIRHRFEGGATLFERWLIGSKRLAHYATEEILELAKQGNVLIRGWGACAIVAGVPHVARIRVCAPMEDRVRTVTERGELKDSSRAKQKIDENDAAHKRMLQLAYGVDREDALLYDVVLNTGRLSTETCVKLIRDLVESADFRETDVSRTILNDKVLEAHIRLKLRERFTVGTGVSGVEVAADRGRVVLSGTAIHRTLVDDACTIAGETPGVKEVVNRMVVVHGPRVF